MNFATMMTALFALAAAAETSPEKVAERVNNAMKGTHQSTFKYDNMFQFKNELVILFLPLGHKDVSITTTTHEDCALSMVALLLTDRGCLDKVKIVFYYFRSQICF